MCDLGGLWARGGRGAIPDLHFQPGRPDCGARYVRHLDAFRGGGGDGGGADGGGERRVVTVLVYLNPDWRPAHGGHLRAYVGRGAAPCRGRSLADALLAGAEAGAETDRTGEWVVDVAPLGGRCLVFAR